MKTILALIALAAVLGILPVPARGLSLDPRAAAAGHIQAEEWEQALEPLEALLESGEANGQDRALLGLVYRKLGRFDDATAAYRAALEVAPRSTMALAGLAITLEAKGEIEEAFEFLRAAVETGISPAGLEQEEAFAGLRQHDDFAAVLELAQRTSTPCLHEDVYDDFDFWLGTWDVFVNDVKRAVNRITKEMEGCIVRERYTNDRGYRGESINYFDPESKTWKQNWVDKLGGVVRYEGGLESEGLMRMTGTNTGRDGETQRARVTWTLQDDGTVRHRIEQSADDGATWNVYFDAVYRKQSE